MAKNVSITDRLGTLDIVVDGHKMTEILSYKVECTNDRRTLTLVIDIAGSVTTKIEVPK